MSHDAPTGHGACCAGNQQHHGHGADSQQKSAGTVLVKDPVCGMDVDPHKTKHRASYAGHPYYFCSAGCRAKFEADPERYLDKEKVAPAPVNEDAIYRWRRRRSTRMPFIPAPCTRR
jgi:P-type Cu+ transporter